MGWQSQTVNIKCIFCSEEGYVFELKMANMMDCYLYVDITVDRTELCFVQIGHYRVEYIKTISCFIACV